MTIVDWKIYVLKILIKTYLKYKFFRGMLVHLYHNPYYFLINGGRASINNVDRILGTPLVATPFSSLLNKLILYRWTFGQPPPSPCLPPTIKQNDLICMEMKIRIIFHMESTLQNLLRRIWSTKIVFNFNYPRCHMIQNLHE